MHAFFSRLAVICFLSLLAGSCGQNENAQSHRLLALGDSYTSGESIDPSQAWPIQLTTRLRNSGIKLGDPLVIARTGWTTDELSNAIDDAQISNQKFDIVTLLIGVNNQFRERSVEEFRKQFVDLLNRAIVFAGGDSSRVIVISIPDWGVMPYAINSDREQIGKAIDAFNKVGCEEAERLHARYVDITPISREAAKDESLIASDGLHPSADQYRRWVDQILPVAKKILERAEQSSRESGPASATPATAPSR